MGIHPALQSVDLIRSWVEDEFPGSVLPVDIFDTSPAMSGFAISVNRGLTLVTTDVTGNPSGPWAVQVGGGLALDVPDLVGPLHWVNARNRASLYGRYYCALAREQGISAVAYVEAFHGVFFEYLTQRSMNAWLRALTRNVVQSTVEEGTAVAAAYGGRIFEPTEQDLMVLFTLMGS